MITRTVELLHRYRGLIVAGLVLVAFNSIFLFVSPERVVEFVGVENTYLTVFLIAAVGGLNTFTSGVLYSAIIAFAAGGATPWLLGVAGGLGIAVGDILMFHLFRYGYMSVSKSAHQRFERMQKYLDAWPGWAKYLGIYAYLGLSPFPNDILMFALAVLGFQFLRILPLIVLGGISVATATAYLGESWPF